jgi:hypothetical protein
MVAEIKLFESQDLTPSGFSLWGWMKSEGNKRKQDTLDDLLARIRDAAACIRKREDQLRRTTRDFRTRVAKCTEVDGGIFEHLL